jgi:hypothetical protein
MKYENLSKLLDKVNQQMLFFGSFRAEVTHGLN